MLQASEYHPRDYLAWYRRTSDFSHVERRKTLVWTPKAAVFLLGALMIIAVFLYATLEFILRGELVDYVSAAALLLLFPFAAAYALAGLAYAFSFLQRSFEYLYLRRAKWRLAYHKGVKIAIAGSFGKTSMREILRAVLSEGKNVAAPPSSVNTPIGIARFVESLKGNEDVLVFELGEYYPRDVEKLCRAIEPDIGVITGVNEAHLEKFRSIGATAKTIFELADFLRGKPLYVNAESALSKERAPTSAYLYSKKGVASWKVRDVLAELSHLTFTLDTGSGALVLHSKLLGEHNVGPLCAAGHIAKGLGLSLDAVRDGIARTEAFSHRMQPREEGGVLIIDDSYNGNPDGAQAAIRFLEQEKGRRRFYVTPGLVEMGPRTESVHREIGESLARAGIERVVLIETSVARFIEEGLKSGGFKGEVLHFSDMPQALEALKHLTVPGDVVLIQNDWPDQYA